MYHVRAGFVPWIARIRLVIAHALSILGVMVERNVAAVTMACCVSSVKCSQLISYDIITYTIRQ